MNEELTIPKFRFGLRQLLLLAFALSGMTVLIYEVVWIRRLQWVFGSAIHAVSADVKTFENFVVNR